MTEAQPQIEALDVMGGVAAPLASALHEDWRKTRYNEADGSYNPRVKPTKDEAWIEANGSDQVDIANTTYEGLPSDWQAENQAAAEVVVGILGEAGGRVDLADETVREQVGERIHSAWLDRNDWAKDGDLGKPFAELPADEQAKDINQMEIALQVFASPEVTADQVPGMTGTEIAAAGLPTEVVDRGIRASAKESGFGLPHFR